MSAHPIPGEQDYPGSETLTKRQPDDIKMIVAFPTLAEFETREDAAVACTGVAEEAFQRVVQRLAAGVQRYYGGS